MKNVKSVLTSRKQISFLWHILRENINSFQHYILIEHNLDLSQLSRETIGELQSNLVLVIDDLQGEGVVEVGMRDGNGAGSLTFRHAAPARE